MKIAGLIIAHHKPENLSRLVSLLKGWGWNTYIHIDAKTDIALFHTRLGTGDFIDRRTSVHWGSWTQILPALDLLRRAVADRDNTHFYLLSGQCFPIKSAEQIHDAIASAEHGGNYMTIERMPVAHKPLSRLSQWHLNAGNVAWAPPMLAKAARRLLPQRNLDRLLHGIPLYGGSCWWLMSRPAAQAILTFVDDNPWYLDAFRYSHCGDEVFFQTLFMHLGRQADNESPTTKKWRPGARNPEVVTPEIYAELSRDWQFMARKFDRFYPESAPGAGRTARAVR